MHKIFRDAKIEDEKSKIPTHDPQTGELNPNYEDLTGQPNPLEIKTSKKDIKSFNELIKETTKNVLILKKEVRELEDSMKRVYKKYL